MDTSYVPIGWKKMIVIYVLCHITLTLVALVAIACLAAFLIIMEYPIFFHVYPELAIALGVFLIVTTAVFLAASYMQERLTRPPEDKGSELPDTPFNWWLST